MDDKYYGDPAAPSRATRPDGLPEPAPQAPPSRVTSGIAPAYTRDFAAGVEAAARAVENFRDKYRAVEGPKRRFNIYDIERWYRAALTMAAEDIRAITASAIVSPEGIETAQQARREPPERGPEGETPESSSEHDSRDAPESLS